MSQSSFVHLHGGARLLDDVKARGAELMFVDVRDTESSARWGSPVIVRPGSDVVADPGPACRMHQAGTPRGPQPTGPRRAGRCRAFGVSQEGRKPHGASAKRLSATSPRRSQKRRGWHSTCLLAVNMGPFGTLAYVALQALMFVTGNLDRRGGSPVSSARASICARRQDLWTGAKEDPQPHRRLPSAPQQPARRRAGRRNPDRRPG